MSPWAVLTPRGRVLICLGAAVTIVGLLLDERDLAAVGVTLMLLCVMAVMMLWRARPHVHVMRTIEPTIAPLGSEITGHLQIDRAAHALARPVVLFEEAVAHELGPRPRFALHQEGGHPRREITYTLRPQQRGRHRVGPLLTDLRDPLGLARALRAHDETTDVLVTPVVWPLDAGNHTGANSDGSDASLHQVGFRGSDDVLIREYRPGDDTRRVHWKSTARTGELMVRREEQGWDPSAVVICDTRDVRAVGSGPTSSLELLVSAATSVALHLLGQGYEVELVDADGHTCRGSHTDLLVGAAGIRPSHLTTLHALRALPRSGSDRVVVAVLCDPTVADAEVIAPLRGHRGKGMALVLDGGTVAGRAPLDCDDATAYLRAKGWQVTCFTAQSSLSQVWRNLMAGGRR